MKYLIVGLGNPGEEYKNTRHNIGFKVLDGLSSGTFFVPDKYGDLSSIKFKGRTLFLLKPTTFMNLSGKAVNYWLQKEKIPLEKLLIVTDDLALPFATLRLRAKGSDGGHNGLKSINEVLGSSKYARLKFGIGNEFAKGKQVNHVLGEWSETEQEKLEKRILLATEIIKNFTVAGVARTMSDYNGR